MEVELCDLSCVRSSRLLLAAVPAWGSEPEKACDSHGTSVEFEETPTEAAQQAKKEEKLVFVLHVSGNFEDPGFT